MSEVSPAVLAEADGPTVSGGLLSQFSPIYALFPQGSADDRPPSESKRADYQVGLRAIG